MNRQADLSIIRLDISHLDGILEIEHLSFASPWSREAYHKELTENMLAHYYGCVHNERLLAFAGFWQIVDEGHIANVAVHPEARGQGLGELLVRHLMAACLSLQGRAMTLEVRESNHIARHLYNKLGFYEMGKRLHYYTDNDEDAIIMWLNLQPQSPPETRLTPAE